MIGTSWGTTLRKYERLAKLTKKPQVRLSAVRLRRWWKAMTREFKQHQQEILLKRMAKEFIREVIPKTPIDTAQARASWTVYLDHIGEPISIQELSDTSQVNITHPLHISPDRISSGRDMGSFLENFKGPKQFIMLINEVPYMIKLEYGARIKSPQYIGFITISIKTVIEKHAEDAGLDAVEGAIIKATMETGARGHVIMHRF